MLGEELGKLAPHVLISTSTIRVAAWIVVLLGVESPAIAAVAAFSTIAITRAGLTFTASTTVVIGELLTTVS
jgi:hypothetical protein